jgi:hypothetical protein
MRLRKFRFSIEASRLVSSVLLLSGHLPLDESIENEEQGEAYLHYGRSQVEVVSFSCLLNSVL